MNRIPEFGSKVNPTKKERMQVATRRLHEFYKSFWIHDEFDSRTDIKMYHKLVWLYEQEWS